MNYSYVLKELRHHHNRTLVNILDGIDLMASSLLLWAFDKGGFRTIMGVDLARPSLGPVKITYEDELAKTANRLIRMKDGEIMS